MYYKFHKKQFVILLFLCAFFLGVLIACLKHQRHLEDAKFLAFTGQLFQDEVSSNTLTLHYTLSEPASYGIHKYPITLGTVSSLSGKKQLLLALEKLCEINRESLSFENQLTYDILHFNFQSYLRLSPYQMLEEPLSPTLGIQAQLPVLLAEYTFNTRQDLKDYLALLDLIPSYFQQILIFEQEKSAAGLFMNDTCARRIIEQCRSFADSANENCLLSSFDEKIASCTFLSPKEKNSYQKRHLQQVLNTLLPAYDALADGLSSLLGSGQNSYGLYYYPQGASYYLSSIQASVGISDSMETIVNRLHKQLNEDYLHIRRLMTVDPALPEKCRQFSSQKEFFSDSQKMLQDLQQKSSYDFPALEKLSYTVKYVPEALAPYLSPAFYFIPPIDTGEPNSIYINQHEKMDELSLYTTLAHEGIPGHMYQTLYFSSSNPNPIRMLYANSGFVEGWATYVEQYAYQYASADYNIGQYAALNRSFFLTLYSLLDIYIHYYGWKYDEVSTYLNTLGITDTLNQADIYQILLENPGNYLKYCLGAVKIRDLKESVQKELGNAFDQTAFHKALLQIGPAPFPVIKTYIHVFLQKN